MQAPVETLEKERKLIFPLPLTANEFSQVVIAKEVFLGEPLDVLHFLPFHDLCGETSVFRVSTFNVGLTAKLWKSFRRIPNVVISTTMFAEKNPFQASKFVIRYDRQQKHLEHI